MTANVTAVMAHAPVTRPGTSSFRPCGSLLSVSVTAATPSERAPKPSPNQKMLRQPKPAVSTLPMIGPRASASPETAAQTPRARARSRRSG